MEEDQSVDMRQWKLETLDCPVVMRVLADGCNSAFGRNLVVRRLLAESFKGWSAAAGSVAVLPITTPKN